MIATKAHSQLDNFLLLIISHLLVTVDEGDAGISRMMNRRMLVQLKGFQTVEHQLLSKFTAGCMSTKLPTPLQSRIFWTKSLKKG